MATLQNNLMAQLKLDENVPLEDRARMMDSAADLVVERVLLRLMEEAGADGRAAIKRAMEGGKKGQELLDEAMAILPVSLKLIDEEIARVAEDLGAFAKRWKK